MKKVNTIALFFSVSYVFGQNATDTTKNSSESIGQVFTIVENMPKFPGGDSSMFKFIKENLKFPYADDKKLIKKFVYISFTIDKDGSVVDVKLLKGVQPDWDAEALRVVRLMPKWIPGTQNGRSVKVQFNLPIAFRVD
jgi:protein TonB